MAKKREKIKYEIINHIGVLSEGTKGWKKELNRVSWNGEKPKYDIRDWNADHTQMSKGSTLTEQDIRALKDILVAEVAFLDED